MIPFICQSNGPAAYLLLSDVPRAETHRQVSESPSFRLPFKARICLFCFYFHDSGLMLDQGQDLLLFSLTFLAWSGLL